MKRPVYETSADRIRERQVLDRVADKFGRIIFQTPKLCRVDGLSFLDGGLTAAMEVKCRKNEAGEYPTLEISKEKIDGGIVIAADLHVPLLLVIRWLDQIGWLNVEHLPEIGTVKRFDRNDPADVEPGYSFPMRQFRMIALGKVIEDYLAEQKKLKSPVL